MGISVYQHIPTFIAQVLLEKTTADQGTSLTESH